MNPIDDKSRQASGHEPGAGALSPRQEDFLNSLLESGGSPPGQAPAPGLPAGCPPDIDGQDGLARALTALSRLNLEEAPSGLLARTMARIRREQAGTGASAAEPANSQTRYADYPMTAARPSKRWLAWNGRKMDIVTMVVAASLVLVVLIAVIGKQRQRAARTLCASNLTSIAAGISEYAAANAGFLPSIAPAENADWLPASVAAGNSISSTASLRRDGNAANLAPLLNSKARFVSWKELVCPTCATAADARGHFRRISYSYIDELGKWNHHFNGSGKVVILADANPLFAGRPVAGVTANSFNHRGAGENILCDDGAVRWVTTPLVGPRQDNIYTIQTVAGIRYTGYEQPVSARDIFLAP